MSIARSGGGSRSSSSSAWLKLQLLLALTTYTAVIASPVAESHQQVVLRPASETYEQQYQLPQHQQQEQSKKRKLKGRFLHITDFHPDDYYKPHTSVDDDISCHRGKGPAGVYGAETTDCDSPLSLANATLAWVEENIKDDIDFVIWTGDSARHDRDEKKPRTSNEVLFSNRRLADDFVNVFSSADGRLAIPIVPTFGNNDFLPHNIMQPGPNEWLHAYGDIWHRFIPEAQRHSFEFGGWFHVEVIPGKLAVLSLNTMYFFDRNAAVDGCASPSEPGYKHMEWLRIQLQQMRESGMKAILMGHVPPARLESKQNWDETCWQRYTLWLQQYRDVVVAGLYGHMNVDHFLLHDTHEITLQTDEVAIKKRSSLADDVSVTSKESYLQALREEWSGLPGSASRVLDTEDESTDIARKGKKRKGNKKTKFRKIGGKYAERYQLSLVSPSVVPNYFPTLRIIEYNITGFEDTPVWEDSYNVAESSSSTASAESSEGKGDDDSLRLELKRDTETLSKNNKKKGKGKGRGKKGKGKKPKDPNLIIPEGPPAGSPPGPAYALQPFTLTGYTQYFANLTYIHNDDSHAAADASKPKDKKPKPHPREFKYEIEYSTFNDTIFKLKDLTVRSYLKLAYRIGKQEATKRPTAGAQPWDEDLEQEDDVDYEYDDDQDDHDDEDDDQEEEDNQEDGTHVKQEDMANDDEDDDKSLDTELAAGKKGKGRKGGKKKHKKNKAWRQFFKFALVSTVTADELDDE